jgi:hypothetical protein
MMGLPSERILIWPVTRSILAMTGAQGIAALERRRAWSALSPKVRVLALGVGLVGAPLLLGFRYYVAASGSETSVKLFGANPFVESALIADFLRRRSDSADRVFILGSEPEILLASERLSATPFVNMRTLSHNSDGACITKRRPPQLHTRLERVW